MIKNTDNSTLELKELEEENKSENKSNQDSNNNSRLHISNASLKYFLIIKSYRFSSVNNSPLPQRSLTLFGEKKIKEHDRIKKFRQMFEESNQQKHTITKDRYN